MYEPGSQIHCLQFWFPILAPNYGTNVVGPCRYVRPWIQNLQSGTSWLPILAPNVGPQIWRPVSTTFWPKCWPQVWAQKFGPEFCFPNLSPKIWQPILTADS